ncbi:uracil-DNA glycosylase [Sphingopyxis sp. MWB1]|uniref:uracil-DNA glycosylase n=1 Tax=Sphingopyxis sp. MWB1 TaxID=1537715 RepID=UPI00051A53FD|nr:uracil-DNA glycosylase [Sphingopyxis sp. MWB1]
MTNASPLAAAAPPRECGRCPRLVDLREDCRRRYPNWWNAPVPAFGDPRPWLAIIGMAPGLRGGNRTGRPFTGDFSGEILFATLARFGFVQGAYGGGADDHVRLCGAAILNVVKCLPPQNKPRPDEVANCLDYFLAELAALPSARLLLTLGRIAHDGLLRALGLRLAAYPFSHGAVHRLPDGRLLIDSYHCSRYNMNTRRMTPAMFDAIFEKALALKPGG